jgi:signal transduction histidine kinase
VVDVELSGDLAGLPPAVDAAVFRLAQEAVTNARRHAQHAGVVRVRVRGDADEVRLTVDDDGHGTGAPGPGGFGLVGMAERAKVLGGTMHAGPRDGGGWSVAAVLPRHGSAHGTAS